MLQRIDLWMGADINNFNLFIGLIFLIFVPSIILITIFNYKLGENDERKKLIQLKINQVVCISLIVFLGLYIVTSNNRLTYMKFYLILIISLSLLSGAIASVYYYIKERI